MCCCQNGTNIMEDCWVFGNNFTSPSQYANPLLKGRYRLKMRGLESLIRGVEWDYLAEGGFSIFITPGWECTADTKILIEFY